jgi:hypothetical protein
MIYMFGNLATITQFRLCTPIRCNKSFKIRTNKFQKITNLFFITHRTGHDGKMVLQTIMNQTAYAPDTANY